MLQKVNRVGNRYLAPVHARIPDIAQTVRAAPTDFTSATTTPGAELIEEAVLSDFALTEVSSPGRTKSQSLFGIPLPRQQL